MLNVKNLTQEEFDLLVGFKFKELPLMEEDKYDQLIDSIAKKIYVILLNSTDLIYPPELLNEIKKTADRINAEELNVKLIDNNNPELK